MVRIALFIALSFCIQACGATQSSTNAPAAAAEATTAPTPLNVKFENIAFKPFNPEKPEGFNVFPVLGSPKAGAFTAIVRMPGGFKSPLHSHSQAFSGVTMSDGVIHASTTEGNKALPKGSAWHQPANEAHLDGCEGDNFCYFMVFFDGPVDMKPSEGPTANPQVKMMPADQIEWVEVKGGVKMAVIDGNPKEGPFTAMFNFPAGMATNVHTHSSSFSGGLIFGRHERGASADALVTLSEGSVWREPADSPHMEKCGDGQNCIIVAHFDGPLDTNNVTLSAK
jgi:quercetin dioxygenase-like cupin family protein